MLHSEFGAAHWRRAPRRRYASGASRHRELVVLLGLSGTARYLLDGVAVTISPGTLIWALAGQAHVLLSDSPDFDMWVFLASRPILPIAKDAPPLSIEDRPQGVDICQLDLKSVQELGALATQLSEVRVPDIASSGYRWWLHRAWTLAEIAKTQSGDAVHPAVARASRLLQDEPGLAMDQLARTAGLSAAHLSKLFRNQTGQSLTRFRAGVRLARVDLSLANDQRTSLTDAALDAGFGSYSQFFRVFREIRGQSPRRYYGLRDAR